MQMKKTLLAVGAVTSIGLAGVAGLGVASAATTTSSDDGGTSSIVSKLAEKFNLKESDVQSVFDEERAAHEATMEQRMEDKLSQAVKDGKLTEAQKDAIIAKHKELRSEREADREAMESMTDEERKAAMEQKRADLEAWAEENDIPEEYFHLKIGGGPSHGGFGGPEKVMYKLDRSAAAAQ